jgi:hypothetical protein
MPRENCASDESSGEALYQAQLTSAAHPREASTCRIPLRHDRRQAPLQHLAEALEQPLAAQERRRHRRGGAAPPRWWQRVQERRCGCSEVIQPTYDSSCGLTHQAAPRRVGYRTRDRHRDVACVRQDLRDVLVVVRLLKSASVRFTRWRDPGEVVGILTSRPTSCARSGLPSSVASSERTSMPDPPSATRNLICWPRRMVRLTGAALGEATSSIQKRKRKLPAPAADGLSKTT